VAGAHAHPAPLAGAEGTREGLRVIRFGAVVLGLSAALRLAVAAASGSVGLLAAGLDDLGDVLVTAALSLAFLASRRAADRRYTFGYQRLEDLAGVAVAAVIWASAGFAAAEAVAKLAGRHEVTRLGVATAAAALGLVANGVVGLAKVRVGRRIGSDPLVADGRHALVDGLASVAALGGLAGVRAGWPAADPIAGLAVVIVIVAVAVEASRQVLARLLDAVDPALVARIEAVARVTPGVADVGRVQARWAGRSLYVGVTIACDGGMRLADAHGVAEEVHHRILHEVPGVAQVDVHVDPWAPHAPAAHAATAEHRPGPA
jgi:cation diffusion facilitator family transporter